MNRPSFLEGVGVALAVSILGAGTLILLLPFFAASLLLKGIAAGIGLGYLVYLLRRARARIGRVSMLVLWSTATAAAFVLDAPLLAMVVVQLGVVWLARALYVHDGVLSAMLDLGLCLLSLAAAAWAAEQSNSLALTLWCLMLVQAAFVIIPDPKAPGSENGTRRDPAPPPSDDDPFQRAHRAAESALRRLSTVR